MQLALQVPIEERFGVAEHLDVVRRAEWCGFDTVLAGEVNGPEAFGLLGAIAASTRSVRLGTGVIAAPIRSAALTAMGFAGLASLAPGRVLAGLGAGAPGVVEGWHQRPFPSPVSAMREFVAEFRAALAGAPSPRDNGFRLGLPPVDVPVLLGAVGPLMLRLAGEIADGVFLTLCPVEEVPVRLAEVRRGEERAGRQPGTVQTTVLLFADAGTRGEGARDRMRSLIARYAAVPTHRAALGDLGGPPGTPPAPADVPDRVVERFLATGRESIARRLADLRGAGVASVAVVPLPPVRGDLDAVMETVDVVAGAHDDTAREPGAPPTGREEADRA